MGKEKEPGRAVGRKQRRNLFFIGNVEDALMKEVVTEIVNHPETEFTLFINSPGGNVYNSMALVNAIRMHGRVDTFCLGVALSAGADVLAAGRHRWIVPEAVVMIHQTSWELEWQFTSNLTRNARHMEKLNEMMMASLARSSGKTAAQVAADAAEDFYLYGQEIVDYGLADEIWTGDLSPFQETEETSPAPPRRRRVANLDAS